MSGDREQPRLLSNGSVILLLKGFCIQTAAKRTREQLVAALLDESTTVEVEVEKSIELLGRFLQTTDFKRLRAEHPELAGTKACSVELRQLEDGSVGWEILPSP